MRKLLGTLVIAIVMLIKAPCLVCADSEVKYNDIIQPLLKDDVVIEIVEVKGDSIKTNSVKNIKSTTEYMGFTQEEIDLLARVVMSEASIEPYECKVAVAKTVLNRVVSEHYPDSVAEVVNAPYQFSTADNGTPNAECYKAVFNAIDYPNCFPNDMVYFRTDYYHDYGFPYAKIGKTCFSTKLNYNN